MKIFNLVESQPYGSEDLSFAYLGHWEQLYLNIFLFGMDRKLAAFDTNAHKSGDVETVFNEGGLSMLLTDISKAII